MLRTVDRSARRAARAQGGSALIEGLIAILIFSLGILGIVGLQAVTTQSTAVAKARVDASFVASQRIAELWGDIENLATKAETDTAVDSLPEGLRTTVINGDQAKVTVTWKMPNDDEKQKYEVIARITNN